MKLYHYIHCPFCIRIRFALGFLGIKYESIVLPYDDEQTPIRLANKKMLPIMDFGSSVMNESLDIIKHLDKENKLHTIECLETYPKLEEILNKLGSDIHSLAMPYFIWTPEFDENSRQYFQSKKEVKRGPFKELVQKRNTFESSLQANLNLIKDYFEKSVNKDTLNLDDILIASHLWGMYIVPEFQYPVEVHKFLQSVKSACNFEYHKDNWS